MTWKLFISAAILVTGLLIKLGAPVFYVGAGIVLAALVTWHQQRKR